MLSVIADRKETTGEVTSRELALAKARDGVEGPIGPFELKSVQLGIDGAGEPFNTCIVVPHKGGGSVKNAPKLAEIPRAGLRCLHECIADAGPPPPASTHIPRAVKVVTLAEWRKRLEKASVIDSVGNPREQFSRIRMTLLDRGAIGIWEEFVWASHSVTSASRDTT